jgi:hypothetical protein
MQDKHYQSNSIEEMDDVELAEEFSLDSHCLSSSSMDGNILFRERIKDVYEEINLCRGTFTIGVQCEDEEIENNSNLLID